MAIFDIILVIKNDQISTSAKSQKTSFFLMFSYVFAIPGLPFSHQILIQFSTFFQTASQTRFFQISQIFSEKCRFLGPSWTQLGPKMPPKSAKIPKNCRISCDMRQEFDVPGATWYPRSRLKGRSTHPTAAQTLQGRDFYRF